MIQQKLGPKDYAVLACAAALFLYGLITIVLSMITLTWSSTPGRTTFASVTRTSSSTDIFMPRFRVEYNYVVDGRMYSSDRYMYGRPLLTPSLLAYRPGTEVEVFYSRRDPSSAVLARGIPGASFLILVSSGLPLLIVVRPDLAKRLYKGLAVVVRQLTGR